MSDLRPRPQRPRSRLLVALVIPEPVRTEIDGLRRALGSRSLARIPPHVTLIPPVNVNDERLGDALAVLARGAATSPPVRLQLGPVATFSPGNPAVFVAVGGDDLGRLRDALSVEPLHRHDTRPFVPHVTIAENLRGARIGQAVDLLAAYAATVTVTRVHLLVHRPDHRWEIAADAPLGGPRVVGRGGLEVTLSTTDTLDAEAAPLVPSARPFVVTARREGAVVGVATGTRDPSLILERLVVDAAARGQGVGTLLLREVLALTDGPASVVCPAGGEAQSWFEARGWMVSLPLPRWRDGQDFVRMERA